MYFVPGMVVQEYLGNFSGALQSRQASLSSTSYSLEDLTTTFSTPPSPNMSQNIKGEGTSVVGGKKWGFWLIWDGKRLPTIIPLQQRSINTASKN